MASIRKRDTLLLARRCKAHGVGYAFGIPSGQLLSGADLIIGIGYDPVKTGLRGWDAGCAVTPCGEGSDGSGPPRESGGSAPWRSCRDAAVAPHL